MVDDVVVSGNVLPFRSRLAPTKIGERLVDRHRPNTLIRDAQRHGANQRSLELIPSEPPGFILKTGALVGLLMLARLLKHVPKTTDFDAVSDHLLKDIGLSRFDF